MDSRVSSDSVGLKHRTKIIRVSQFSNNENGMNWTCLKQLYAKLLVPSMVSYLFSKDDKSKDEKLNVQELRNFLRDRQKGKQLLYI